MLFYLDNSSSADPHAFDRLKLHPVRARPGVKLPPLGPKRGLNENYGRELMELHTLGVDGGYTQQDVIDVARAFNRMDDRIAAGKSGVLLRRTLARSRSQARSRKEN